MTQPRTVAGGARMSVGVAIVGARFAGLGVAMASWYVDRSTGRVALLWPGSVEDFRAPLAGIGSRDFLTPNHPYHS